MNKRIPLIFRTLSAFLSIMILCVSLFSCTPSEGTPSESSSEPQSSPEATPIETPKEESTPEPSVPETTEPETEPETEPAPKPITLKIGSYNIANGSAVNHDMSKLAEDIVDKELDIVGFQEVDQKALRSKRRDTMKLISEASGLHYYAFFKAIDLQGGEYGVAVLSKYPIVETHRTDLYSGTEEQRVLGHAVIDVDGVLINFFVTHLSYESKALRDEQFATIAEKTAGLDNFIITGDFNTSNFSEYSVIKNADMVNNAKHSINTFSNPNPTSSIDNIVFSKGNWTFGKPAALPNGKSDHCLLYAQGTFDPN